MADVQQVALLKVAFLDDAVNLPFLKTYRKNCTSKGSIEQIKLFDDDNLYRADPSHLSHASLCALVFLQHVALNCQLFFVPVLDYHTLKGNGVNLQKALDWCFNHKIDVINLSIGTTQLENGRILHPTIMQLAEKGTIIVAASDNRNKMTIPAVWPQVISVKNTDGEISKDFLYFHHPYDGIDLTTTVKEQIIYHDDQAFYIYPCNSYAAPRATAKVCEYISNGHKNLAAIRSSFFKEYGSSDVLVQTLEQNITAINIPVILINRSEPDATYNEKVFNYINQLLELFLSNGYIGLCFTDRVMDQYNAYMLFLHEELPKKIINFYSNYAEIDYLLLDISQEKESYYIKKEEIDFTIYQNEIGYRKNHPSTVLKALL